MHHLLLRKATERYENCPGHSRVRSPGGWWAEGGDAQISEGWSILRKEAWESTVGRSNRTGHKLESAP